MDILLLIKIAYDSRDKARILFVGFPRGGIFIAIYFGVKMQNIQNNP